MNRTMLAGILVLSASVSATGCLGTYAGRPLLHPFPNQPIAGPTHVPTASPMPGPTANPMPGPTHASMPGPTANPMSARVARRVRHEGHPPPAPPRVHHGLPTEKEKVTHPEYVLEAPDILLIDVIRAIPKGPYRIQPLDSLMINSPQALREEPIAGVYPVGPEGRVNLGLNYGTVQVADMTVEEAEEAVRKHLATLVPKPRVTVALAQIGAIQQIRGEHIINPDGTVRLGKYGSVYVAGMTLDQAKSAIEAHLSESLVRPEVSISVYAYNSKHYYVITDYAGFGEGVFRFPATGNETVLDALSMINGLPWAASKRRIWVARPAPPQSGLPDQILPVDWNAVVRGGDTWTNFQLLPGDRVYVMAQPVVTATTWLSRVLEPVE
ncbi:MAG: polysaccharide biosynthesis/export family protein, partial [Gemmataceae bacterium]|nr:polysaccharide biosynthesis/export family protein [Gemmataceae bacterium]